MVLWVGVFSLLSCSQLLQPLPAKSIAPNPSHVSVMTIETLVASPTRLNIDEVQEQVTDGKLLISVEIIESKCYRAGEPITFKILFHNLTNQRLRLLNEFDVAPRGGYGDILAYIFLPNKQPMYNDYALVKVDYVWPTPTKNYIEIPAAQNYAFTFDFPFPKEYVKSISNHNAEYATPTPGRYYIRFVYISARSNDVWKGEVGSNQLEICIID